MAFKANIAERFEQYSNKEFIRFLPYSKNSVGEVKSLLYVALDLRYIPEAEFNDQYKTSINSITPDTFFKEYLDKTKRGN